MNNETEFKNRIISTLINSIYQSIQISRACSIGVRENESLSIDSFSKIHTSITELSSAARLIDLLADFIIDKTDIFTTKKYYVIEEYFNAAVKKLSNMFLDKQNISFKFSSALSKERTFYINEFEIERIVLPIIYFIVKSISSESQTNVKIVFSEKPGKESKYVVTVTAKGDTFSKDYADIINGNEITNFLFYNPDSISALVLRQNVEAISGTISYIKSGLSNKITFTFPHINALDDWTLKEPCTYIPDDNAYMNLFSSLLN